MLYLSVIPIVRLPRNVSGSFTYSSESAVSSGTLVRVPLRGKSVYGFVVKKEGDRQREFRVLSIKKSEDYSLSHWYLTFIKKLPSVMFEHPGTILKSVLNRISWHTLADSCVSKGSRPTPPPHAAHRPGITRVIYSSPDERLSFLSDAVSQSQKKKSSLLIMVPGLADARKMFLILNKLFHNLVFIHGAASASQVTKAMFRGGSPTILSTRTGVFLPIRLDSIICDDEPNPLYQHRQPAPTYDAREIANMRVSYSGEHLIRSGYSLRKTKTDSESFVHELDRSKLVWADMKHSARDSIYFFVSDSALGHAPGGPVLFITLGKSFSQRVTCSGCGYVFQCPNCDRSYRTVDEHTFLCPSCAKRDSIPPFCPACNGTSFSYPRMGAAQVKIKLRSLLDTSAAFDVCALSEVDRLELSQFHTIVIVSLDTLMTHEFNSFENLAHSLIKLQKIFHGQLVIQYRSEQLRGQISNLKFALTSDLETRKKLSYPPFGDLYTIRYSPRSRKHLSENEAGKLIADLLSTTVEHVVSWSTKKRGLPYMTFNVKLAKGQPFDWRKLPQEFHINKM